MPDKDDKVIPFRKRIYDKGTKINELPATELGDNQTRYDYLSAVYLPNMAKYSAASYYIGDAISSENKLVISGFTASADITGICHAVLRRYTAEGVPYTFMGGFFSIKETFAKENPFEIFSGERLGITIGNYSGGSAMIYFYIDAYESVKR